MKIVLTPEQKIIFSQCHQDQNGTWVYQTEPVF
jgi:Spy/CpxP family protein refolding chaperone